MGSLGRYAGLIPFLLTVAASAADPVVSIITPPSAKKFASVFESSAKVFDRSPFELTSGTEKAADDSSKVIIQVTGLQFLNEQQADGFIRETRFSGVPVWRTPVIEGWKNVAARYDYKVIIRDGKKRRKKDRSALGIALGRAGSSTDVKLNDNFESLAVKAALRAADRWHFDLLEEVVIGTPISNEMMSTIGAALQREEESRFRGNQSGFEQTEQALFFPPKAIRTEQDFIEADFQINNRLPFRVDFEVEYFGVRGTPLFVSIDSIAGPNGATSTFSLAPNDKVGEKITWKQRIYATDKVWGIFMRLKGRPKYSL